MAAEIREIKIADSEGSAFSFGKKRLFFGFYDRMISEENASKASKGTKVMNEVKVIEKDRKVVSALTVKKKTSPMRKMYIAQLIGRSIILIGCICLGILLPQEFDILQDFTGRFSVLHILWGMWMFDMLLQLVFVKKHVPLGSQKLFRQRYIPVAGGFDGHGLREYIRARTKSAYQVFLIYGLGIAVLGLLKKSGVLGDIALLIICVAFYVCDLICVLIWCPFRIFMKTRCCTECRIFNWDHLMMFSPLFFVDGFYARSLVTGAVGVFLLWEYSIMVYPERFWEHSNEALKCSNCTDKLCSQYCGKQKIG